MCVCVCVCVCILVSINVQGLISLGRERKTTTDAARRQNSVRPREASRFGEPDGLGVVCACVGMCVYVGAGVVCMTM